LEEAETRFGSATIRRDGYPSPPPLTMVDASRDPLAAADPAAAARLYGLDASARPTVAVRKLRDAVWGSPPTGIAGLGLRLQQRFLCSERAAAEQAVALPAERGCWITFGGSGHPATFHYAVKLVRAEMAAQRRGNRPVAPDGNTGGRLLVRPARPGLVVRDLDRPDRQPIPEDGKEVSDTAYWRRRLACGDVILAEPGRK
jgi:hypothetical protein